MTGFSHFFNFLLDIKKLAAAFMTISYFLFLRVSLHIPSQIDARDCSLMVLNFSLFTFYEKVGTKKCDFYDCVYHYLFETQFLLE